MNESKSKNTDGETEGRRGGRGAIGSERGGGHGQTDRREHDRVVIVQVVVMRRRVGSRRGRRSVERRFALSQRR
jgi:hypothetical protein